MEVVVVGLGGGRGWVLRVGDVARRRAFGMCFLVESQPISLKLFL